MPTTLNRAAFERLVAEDIAWLEHQPRTLERDHILDLLRDSTRVYYDLPNGHYARRDRIAPPGRHLTVWYFDPARAGQPDNAQEYADQIFGAFLRVPGGVRPQIISINVIGIGSALYDRVRERFIGGALSPESTGLIIEAYDPRMAHPTAPARAELYLRDGRLRTPPADVPLVCNLDAEHTSHTGLMNKGERCPYSTNLLPPLIRCDGIMYPAALNDAPTTDAQNVGTPTLTCDACGQPARYPANAEPGGLCMRPDPERPGTCQGTLRQPADLICDADPQHRGRSGGPLQDGHRCPHSTGPGLLDGPQCAGTLRSRRKWPVILSCDHCGRDISHPGAEVGGKCPYRSLSGERSCGGTIITKESADAR